MALAVNAAKPASASPRWSRQDHFTIATLLVAIALVFGQTIGFDFLPWDDPTIFSNPALREGLTPNGLQWALTTQFTGLWQPLTWASLMLDTTLWGQWAGGHHLSNVVIHFLAASALYLWLREATGDRLRSALVAMLFAIHPLRAESVAWVSERKDVLCALFWMLCLLAHQRWLARRSAAAWCGMTIAFVAAIAAKPMAVTLPAILLLTMYWPARHASLSWPQQLRAGLPALLPLFAIAAAAAWITLHPFAETGQPAADRSGLFTLETRLQLALATFGTFVWKTLWPVDLAFFHPVVWSTLSLKAVGGAFVLAAMGVLAWHQRRARPWVAFGLAWYVVVLLPASGIVQIGGFAYADRYAYLPLTGLFIALVWTLPCTSWRSRSTRAVAAACLLCVPVAIWQTAYWRDMNRLSARALEIYPDNVVAHNFRAKALMQANQPAAALVHALAIIDSPASLKPVAATGHVVAGDARWRLGEAAAAERHWRSALELDPASWEGHSRVGFAALRAGRYGEAVARLERAIAMHADDVDTRTWLAAARERIGDFAGAAAALRAAIALAPGNPQTHVMLGSMLERAGDRRSAGAAYRDALRLQPDHAGARAGAMRTG